MPRGQYDRSKTKRTTVEKSPKVSKTSKVTQANSSSLDDKLTYLERCAGILSVLVSTPQIPETHHAKALITNLINGLLSTMVSKSDPVPTGPAAVPTPSVVYTATTPPPDVGVKLKKDGTPKKRPGPKPKAEVVLTSNVSATIPGPEQVASKNPTGVFNPEHAGN